MHHKNCFRYNFFSYYDFFWSWEKVCIVITWNKFETWIMDSEGWELYLILFWSIIYVFLVLYITCSTKYSNVKIFEKSVYGDHVKWVWTLNCVHLKFEYEPWIVYCDHEKSISFSLSCFVCRYMRIYIINYVLIGTSLIIV